LVPDLNKGTKRMSEFAARAFPRRVNTTVPRVLIRW
jgi:hypothetical protein